MRTALGLLVRLTQKFTVYAREPTATSPSTVSNPIRLSFSPRDGLPNRKLASAADGAAAGFRPARSFAFFNASRMRLISSSRSKPERARIFRKTIGVSSIEDSLLPHGRLFDP